MLSGGNEGAENAALSLSTLRFILPVQISTFPVTRLKLKMLKGRKTKIL